jgi:RimJ/RimL family protein N-acetyltransferase
MNCDPEVMRFFPRPLTREECSEAINRFRTEIDSRGWGIWAVEADGIFAGSIGLAQPKFQAHFTPCVEIGWRLRKEFWGKGIAYQAACQAEEYAFNTLEIRDLVSYTTTMNVRSRALMERLGFVHNPAEDFLHPSIPEESPLRPHVLYRKRSNSVSAVLP